MKAAVRTVRVASLLTLGALGIAACAKRDESATEASASAAPSGSAPSVTDAATTASSASASGAPKSPPMPGPATWAAAYEGAIGERPTKALAPAVKVPALECANSIGSAVIRDKFKDEYTRLVDQAAKGEPERVADWAARYRPWHIARTPLLRAIAEGCAVAGREPFANECAGFKASWERLDTTKPFACRAIANITRAANGVEIDTLVCEVESFAGLVLVDVPKEARANVLGDAVRDAAANDGIAGALGVPSLNGTELALASPTEPGLVELRGVTSIRRHSRSEGFLDRTVRSLEAMGISRPLAGALLARGDVWQVSLPTEGGAALQLTKRGDPSERSRNSGDTNREKVPVVCETIEARWDRAYCELRKMPEWARADLATPLPLTTEGTSVIVATSEAAPGDGGAFRQPIERLAGAEIWRRRVLELGGFEPIACTLSDVTRSKQPRITSVRRAMAARAGVAEGDLTEHLFECVGDERTSARSILVRIPSHRISARGGFDAERSQRGVVRIDGYTADAAGLLQGDLAKFGTSTPPFADLARAAQLRISGYSKVWRSGDSWVVAFEPECPDEGFGCTQNDGFDSKVELLSQPACNVSGYVYP